MSNSGRAKQKENSQIPHSSLMSKQSAKNSAPLLLSQQEIMFNDFSNPDDKTSNTDQKISFSKNNLSDPHLSFLQYLETDRAVHRQREMIEEQMASCLNKSITGISSSNASDEKFAISDSWHNVEKSEFFGENLNLISNSTHYKNINMDEYGQNKFNNVGILSSSDNSSEEESQYGSFAPSLLTASNLKGKKSPSQMFSQQEMSYPSTSLSNPVNTLSVGDNNNNNFQDIAIEEDLNVNNIVTKSLSSSSNSFIMPKICFKREINSLALNGNKPYDKGHYILILGRHGLHFFKSIPFEYQQLFQLPTSHDPKDFEQYHGIIIIVKELRELITLLNRVSKLDDGGPPLIVLYYNDQRVQVKNIIKSFLRKHLITLYYPPIDIENDEELNKLFHHIKLSLSNGRQMNKDIQEAEPLNKQTSCKLSPLSFDSLDNSNSQSRKRKKHNGQTPNQVHSRFNIYKKKQNGDVSKNNKRNKENKPKRWFHYFSNKWIKWGISISVSISAAYYIKHSYNINKESIPFVTTILDTKIFNKLKNISLVKIFATLFQNMVPRRINQQEYSATSIPVNDATGTKVDSTSKPVLDYCFKFIKYPLIKVNNFIKNTIVATTKCRNIPLEKLNKINNWNIEDPNNIITLSYITP